MTTQLGRVQLLIMQVLWDKQQATAREITDAISERESIAHSTVQTLLRIMADKGLVKQRNEARKLYYSPNYSVENASSRFLHKVFDGAVDKLVLSMLQAEDISPDEMRELEKMIAKARKHKQDSGDR